MNLDFFKEIGNTLKRPEVREKIDKFLGELSNFLENSTLNKTNESTKYSNYWKYQNFMEDSVSASLGLSRYANDITYHEELGQAIDDSILELSEQEGPLYRKQYRANGLANSYKIEKFEDGKIETAAEHQPDYLRVSQAERERKERLGND